MTTPPSSSQKRRPAVAKRIGRKLDARVKPDNASSAEPGLVDQVRAMAGRLLDISAATGVAGRALQTAGKVSRALQENFFLINLPTINLVIFHRCSKQGRG